MALSVQRKYKHTRLEKEPTSEVEFVAVSHWKACRGAWFGQILRCSRAVEQRFRPKGVCESSERSQLPNPAATSAPWQ